MPVEDVFDFRPRHCRYRLVERGTLKLNDPVEILGIKAEKKTWVATGIEMFTNCLIMLEAGDKYRYPSSRH